ncbi:hypothetical protein [Patulibacter minatonensis]|uniref:hypothetical protein n=1 Tax=Patulibacter minatonensis TaxID=298163 RepID=UPI0012FA057B|nr:hypothetical protein [Patulibacter minatonensis]
MSRSSVLVLLAVTGAALGPPAASASDVGLRTLVTQEAKAEKEIKAAGKALKDPRSGSAKALARYFRRAANHFDDCKDTYDRYRSAFAREGSETPEVERGRHLVQLGLRDESAASADAARLLRRTGSQVRRASTDAGIDRTVSRFEKRFSSIDARGTRGEKRVKQGARIIRNAPAPTPPAA